MLSASLPFSLASPGGAVGAGPAGRAGQGPRHPADPLAANDFGSYVRDEMSARQADESSRTHGRNLAAQKHESSDLNRGASRQNAAIAGRAAQRNAFDAKPLDARSKSQETAHGPTSNSTRNLTQERSDRSRLSPRHSQAEESGRASPPDPKPQGSSQAIRTRQPFTVRPGGALQAEAQPNDRAAADASGVEPLETAADGRGQKQGGSAEANTSSDSDAAKPPAGDSSARQVDTAVLSAAAQQSAAQIEKTAAEPTISEPTGSLADLPEGVALESLSGNDRPEVLDGTQASIQPVSGGRGALDPSLSGEVENPDLAGSDFDATLAGMLGYGSQRGAEGRSGSQNPVAAAQAEGLRPLPAESEMPAGMQSADLKSDGLKSSGLKSGLKSTGPQSGEFLRGGLLQGAAAAGANASEPAFVEPSASIAGAAPQDPVSAALTALDAQAPAGAAELPSQHDGDARQSDLAKNGPRAAAGAWVNRLDEVRRSEGVLPEALQLEIKQVADAQAQALEGHASAASESMTEPTGLPGADPRVAQLPAASADPSRQDAGRITERGRAFEAPVLSPTADGRNATADAGSQHSQSGDGRDRNPGGKRAAAAAEFPLEAAAASASAGSHNGPAAAMHATAGGAFGAPAGGAAASVRQAEAPTAELRAWEPRSWESVRLAAAQREDQPAANGAVRELGIRLPLADRSEIGGAQQVVDVHVRERAGQLDVSVRTGDASLAQDVRKGLEELVRNLETQGFEAQHAEARAVREAAPSGPERALLSRPADASQSQDAQANDSGASNRQGGNRQQSGRGGRNRNEVFRIDDDDANEGDRR